jgi:hypothetical protein
MFNKYGSEKKKLHIMKGREHSDSREDEDYEIASKYLRHLYYLYNADTDEKLSEAKIKSMTPSKYDTETDVPDEQIFITNEVIRSIPSNFQMRSNFSGTGSSFDSEGDKGKGEIKDFNVAEGDVLNKEVKKGLTLTTDEH